MEKEIRNLQGNTVRKGDSSSRTVEGTAIVFNSDSQDMGYVERIMNGAVDEEVVRRSDIFCYLNHDSSRGVLARSRYGEGSLKITIQDDGLHYSFEAPNTELGNELLSYLERGEITTSSFAFTVADGGDKWYRDNNGVLRRDIYKIDKLYDVSPVWVPAYEATSCSKRKLDEIQAIDEKLDNIKKVIENL